MMQRQDIIFLGALLVIAPLLTALHHGTFLSTICIYMVVPAIYFSCRSPSSVKKAFLMGLPAIPLTLVFDYIAYANNAWTVQTVFPFRIFTYIPVEDFLFTFLLAYAVVVARDTLTGSSSRPNYRRYKLFWAITAALTILFFVAYLWAQSSLIIPYPYFMIVLIFFIIPTGLGFWWFPPLRKFLLAAILYNIALFLPWEFFALHYGIWTFPGQYIGFVSLFGFRFPWEEFLMFSVLGITTLTVAYEIGLGRKRMF
jgi:hypothetical protein